MSWMNIHVQMYKLSITNYYAKASFSSFSLSRDVWIMPIPTLLAAWVTRETENQDIETNTNPIEIYLEKEILWKNRWIPKEGIHDYLKVMGCLGLFTSLHFLLYSVKNWDLLGSIWYGMIWLRNLRAFLKRGSILWQKWRVSFALNLTYIFLNICFLMCAEKFFCLLLWFCKIAALPLTLTPHWWKSFTLDLATGLLKGTQWPFLGAGQNKGKIQVRLSFHLWFDLSAQACEAWNLSGGRDEWNRRNKLIRFSNDWVPSFPSHQAPWKNNKW